MSDMTLSHRLGPPLLAALLATGPVQAQIVTDGSVGRRESLSSSQMNIGADLGTQVGGNRISNQVALHVGTTIRLGKTLLEVRK